MHFPAGRICRYLSTKIQPSSNPKFCIIGSGPAGFYTAQGLTKAFPNASIDIYEKQPVPFGLVRYGVAPVHPDVKNAINAFTSTAQKDLCSFNGNVAIGKDVTLEQLQKAYHAVVLCTGAYNDKRFGVPGEDLPNVLSSRSFVGWYNGLPENSKLNVNLDVETVAVLGHGNVALDVAKILLTKIDILKKTDITEYALETLSRSRVKRVVLIGRRGPMQVAFTTKELRDMFSIEGCTGIIKHEDLKDINNMSLDSLQRPRRRLMELVLSKATSVSNAGVHNNHKVWELAFLRSPIDFFASDNSKTLAGIHLNVNTLQDIDGVPQAVPTGNVETFECGLALRSIGYTNKPIESSLPFNAGKGTVDNINGHVKSKTGLYCSGWAAIGPVGVLLSTMNDSFQLSRTILEDVKNGQLNLKENKDGKAFVMELLKAKNVQVVSFDDWLKIDKEEQNRGAKLGKPREKITDIQEILRIAR